MPPPDTPQPTDQRPPPDPKQRKGRSPSVLGSHHSFPLTAAQGHRLERLQDYLKKLDDTTSAVGDHHAQIPTDDQMQKVGTRKIGGHNATSEALVGIGAQFEKCEGRRGSA
ncbi:hypothetical protein DRE_00179 [Drechslerella stenobrocha 248]|uniref:Uncharacterized protein n=1 Tax=Drechslerella stenobrocha 248 TaxID=1043628 RepID=W7HZD3_9PEZI|nr:hypothetical protein DRE_00179 [Drechslerella stenobrocha 248]